MTLAEAAEIGTHKVIGEHSTIGLVVTTDGSFTELPREAYIPAEKRVIEELQSLGKPFLVLVNSSEPNGEAAQRVCDELQSQYRITPIAVNCLELDESGIADILQQVLYEFPVCEDWFCPSALYRYSAAASSGAEQHLPVHSHSRRRRRENA